MDADWIEVTVTPRMGDADIEAAIARAFRRLERRVQRSGCGERRREATRPQARSAPAPARAY